MLQGKVTFVAALREFMGDPQITTQELKDLSEADRMELRELLTAEGYEMYAPGETPPR